MSVKASGVGFGFSFSRPKEIILQKGQSIIISYWKWWPPGWKKKLVQINESGDVEVTRL